MDCPGLKTLKDSPARVDAFRKAFASSGVTMTHFFLVTGRYDMVAVMEAPDDTALARAMLSVASLGNLTSETCRAFTEDEYRKIIGSLA